MSRNLNGVPIIEKEPDNICHTCGKIAETRPYGPGGSEICYECGLKIPDIVNHNIGVKLYGEKKPLMGKL